MVTGNAEIFNGLIARAAAGKGLAGAEAGEGLTGAEAELLRGVADEYPWFAIPRLILYRHSGEYDPTLALFLQAYPQPFRRNEVSADDFMPAAPGHDDTHVDGDTRGGTETRGDTDDLIDKFLGGGEHRITPSEETPEDDAAAGSAEFDPDGDMVSEELAAIYLAQGLNEQAKKIYRKLSLLNPEKSVYFAEIIDRIDDGRA